MDTNEKQIALSVLESLRADLMYAHLKNGSRILDVADLRQYIYENDGPDKNNCHWNVLPVRQRQWPPAGKNLARATTGPSLR